MDFSDKTFLYLLIFVMPGFIFNKVRAMSVAKHADTEKGTLMAAIATSAWLAAPLLPFGYFYQQKLFYVYQHPSVRAGIVAFALLFVWPLIAAIAAIKIGRMKKWRWVRDFLSINASEPRSWDYYFNQKRHCMVKITLKDGTHLRGYFGSRSFASSYPAAGDLYLQEEYTEKTPSDAPAEAGNKEIGPVELTDGFWVDMSEVRCIQFSQIPIQVSGGNMEKLVNEKCTADNSDKPNQEPSTEVASHDDSQEKRNDGQIETATPASDPK